MSYGQCFKVYGGKYTFILHADARIEIRRYDQEWIHSFSGLGDRAVLALVIEHRELLDEVEKLNRALGETLKSIDRGET